MKHELPDNIKKRFRGLRPAIAVEAFIVVLVLSLLVWGDFATWLLNALKRLFGR